MRFRIRRWFRLRELPWIGLQLAKKLLCLALPIGAHLWIARARAWAKCRIEGVPGHVGENIRSTVLGEITEPSEIQRIARRTVTFRQSSYVTNILPTLPGFANPRRWPVRGLEHLDTALQQGRGTLLVSAHFGYGHLIAPILRAHGYEVVRFFADLDRAQRDRRQEWLAAGSALRRFVYHRTRIGADRHADDHPVTLDVRPIFDALSRNRPVFLTADGMRSMHFERVSLLGRVYPLPTGFMRIAIMARAPLLPVFALEGDGHGPIMVEIEPALPVDPAVGLSENLQRFVAVFESRLQSSPHLWNRWKVRRLFDRALDWTERDPEERYSAVWYPLHELEG